MTVHQNGNSIFPYPLTRKYPFRWFTYVAVIDGVICTILFSFVALAADGYNLELEYTLDLDSTLGARYWFDKAPFSWISKTNVSCQPALLTTGNTFFTSNLGLTYELDRLWRADSGGARPKVLPASGYFNTPLRECDVREIEINFMKRFDAQVYYPWNWDMTTTSATVTCTFSAPSGDVKANLTISLPPIYDAVDIETAHPLGLTTNISAHASLWFGAQFTNLWYQQLSPAMGYAPYSKSSNETWSSGTVILSRNPAVTNYTDLNFFFAWANFFTDTGTFVWLHPPSTIAGWRDEPFSSTHVLPNITTTLDTFAKSLYALLLSDLGVVDGTNALLTPAGAKWLGDQSIWTSGRTRRPRSEVQNAFNASGPQYRINDTYQAVADAIGGPPDLNNTTLSRIFTQYLCSVPKRKAGGALFFAVLLADLVFLQTAWTLLNFGAGWWLKRSDKEGSAGFCEGCSKRSTAGGLGGSGVGGAAGLSVAGGPSAAGVAGARVEGASGESLGSTLEDGRRADAGGLGSMVKRDEGVGVSVRERSRSSSEEGVEQRKPLLSKEHPGDPSDFAGGKQLDYSAPTHCADQ